MNEQKDEIIEEILRAMGALSPKAQKAAAWLISHFDFAMELCKMGRLSPELRDEMRAYAKEKDDPLSLMLIELEEILHPEK